MLVYWVQHSKRPEKLDFQLAIPLRFEVFAAQPDLIAQGIALELYSFIVGLAFKALVCDEGSAGKQSSGLGA